MRGTSCASGTPDRVAEVDPPEEPLDRRERHALEAGAETHPGHAEVAQRGPPGRTRFTAPPTSATEALNVGRLGQRDEVDAVGSGLAGGSGARRIASSSQPSPWPSGVASTRHSGTTSTPAAATRRLHGAVALGLRVPHPPDRHGWSNPPGSGPRRPPLQQHGHQPLGLESVPRLHVGGDGAREPPRPTSGGERLAGRLELSVRVTEHGLTAAPGRGQDREACAGHRAGGGRVPAGVGQRGRARRRRAARAAARHKVESRSASTDRYSITRRAGCQAQQAAPEDHEQRHHGRRSAAHEPGGHGIVRLLRGSGGQTSSRWGARRRRRSRARAPSTRPAPHRSRRRPPRCRPAVCSSSPARRPGPPLLHCRRAHPRPSARPIPWTSAGASAAPWPRGERRDGKSGEQRLRACVPQTGSACWSASRPRCRRCAACPRMYPSARETVPGAPPTATSPCTA